MEDICECIHEDTIKKVKACLLDENTNNYLAEFFKVFSDPTRIKIINALLNEELCVCDIASITDNTPSAISHQLRILKQAKLVKYKKVGKTVYYSLDDNHIKEIFEKGCEHIEEI